MDDSRIPKNMQDVLDDEGPQERLEEDWTMLFREMRYICYRYRTGRLQRGGEGWRKEIGETTVRKRGQMPHKKNNTKNTITMIN
jgi:hypothetical protein